MVFCSIILWCKSFKWRIHFQGQYFSWFSFVRLRLHFELWNILESNVSEQGDWGWGWGDNQIGSGVGLGAVFFIFTFEFCFDCNVNIEVGTLTLLKKNNVFIAFIPKDRKYCEYFQFPSNFLLMFIRYYNSANQ